MKWTAAPRDDTLGIFLEGVPDRSSPVYVIATANNIKTLPGEFTRKGRFDELYGAHLPTHAKNARRSPESTCGCENTSRSSST